MKKLLCILLTFALLTTFVTAMADAVEFLDFSPAHWAYNNVNEMVSKGIIKGYPDGTFRPEDNVTRGEFCAMLSKAANLYIDENATGNHWATPYAETIKQATWTYEDWYLKNTDLDATINRSEAALGICDVYLGYPQSLIFKMAEVNNYLQASYKDFSNIGDFAECVYTLSKNGIMNGYEDGCFHPEYPITRAELCTVLLRAFSGKNTGNRNTSINESNKKNDYSTAYNKLKAWLISNNESLNETAKGIFYSYNDVDLAIIYIKDSSIGFTAITTLESGAKFKMNLILPEKDISPGVVSTLTTASGSENKVVGTYNSSEITIISSDSPQTNDMAINSFKQTYPLFDTLMESKGIDLKISDFGINY